MNFIFLHYVRRMLDKLDPYKLKSFLNKSWMTHDAMWFKLSVENVGIEKTNYINRKAVIEMAKIEIKRLIILINFNPVKNIDDLIKLIQSCFAILSEDYISFNMKKTSEHSLKFQITKCFAYEGVTKLGYIDDYECGIYDRIEGWFEGINLRFEKDVIFKGCLMHHIGECVRNYTFNFPI